LYSLIDTKLKVLVPRFSKKKNKKGKKETGKHNLSWRMILLLIYLFFSIKEIAVILHDI